MLGGHRDVWPPPRAVLEGGLMSATVGSANRTTAEGLTFAGYAGDGAALLAFDADEAVRERLAGFALRYLSPDGQQHDVLNRLSFAQQITAETAPAQRRFTPTSDAPIQKFHWIHFPPDVQPGEFTYTATA